MMLSLGLGVNIPINSGVRSKFQYDAIVRLRGEHPH